MLGCEAIGYPAFNRIGPGLEIHADGIGVFVAARLAAAVGTTMDEARWDTLVDIAAFLHFDPALVTNQREAAVERRRRKAGDAAAGSIFKINLGADKILGWRGKYLRSGAAPDTHWPPGE